MELGVYSFGDTHRDPKTGRMVGAHQRLRELIAEIELADQVGLDVFGVGEHHRPDFAVSAPAVVLAAAAERTTNIRLTSAVAVLSSEDPVRVFQQYATVDLLSDGRAEIMAGRGSFIESFPLFGYDLHDYESLFAEKLELLLALREQETLSWAGRYRPPLDQQTVYPRPLQERIPIWIAVGGTPNSVVRAGMLGLPMGIAIIGGAPEPFRPLAELYRSAAGEACGRPAHLLRARWTRVPRGHGRLGIPHGRTANLPTPAPPRAVPIAPHPAAHRDSRGGDINEFARLDSRKERREISACDLTRWPPQRRLQAHRAEALIAPTGEISAQKALGVSGPKKAS